MLNNSTLLPKPLSLDANDPLLRIPDVERQTGLKKSAIYNLISLGNFPPPIKLSSRASGWLLSEINLWKRERIAASRQEVKL